MRQCLLILLLSSLLPTGMAAAQVVATGTELLDSDRPESWAMNYVEATTLMTPIDSTVLGPGQFSIAGDLGSIPRLSAEQRQVGLAGFKREDLNKSPVFGRVRIAVGLPASWVVELGWTPPVAVNGLKTRDLFSSAIGRQWFASSKLHLYTRLFGQQGAAEGDITCPADVVGNPDPDINPVGCVGRSRDRIALRQYGLDATGAWDVDAWHWGATAGVVRMEPVVQVDAPLEGVRERTRLVSRSVRPYFALGGGRDLGAHWRASAEILYVPLPVRRDPGNGTENDALTSLRLQLRWLMAPSNNSGVH